MPPPRAIGPRRPTGAAGRLTTSSKIGAPRPNRLPQHTSRYLAIPTNAERDALIAPPPARRLRKYSGTGAHPLVPNRHGPLISECATALTDQRRDRSPEPPTTPSTREIQRHRRQHRRASARRGPPRHCRLGMCSGSGWSAARPAVAQAVTAEPRRRRSAARASPATTSRATTARATTARTTGLGSAGFGPARRRILVSGSTEPAAGIRATARNRTTRHPTGMPSTTGHPTRTPTTRHSTRTPTTTRHSPRTPTPTGQTPPNPTPTTQPAP